MRSTLFSRLQTPLGALCALVFCAAAPAGCATIVGVDDFSVEGEQPAASSASSSGGSADPCGDVHGCSRDGMETVDYTGVQENLVYVSFEPTKYTPRCIRIRDGMTVNFNSIYTFADYPIAGGTYPKQDPGSPIQNPLNDSVNELEVTFKGGCGYPYFSPPNGDTMQGVVYVGGSD